MKLTNAINWEAAKKAYPLFASEERLKQFSGLSMKNGVPAVFQSYCQGAMDRHEQRDTPVMCTIVGNEGCTATLLKGNIKSITVN